MNTIKDVEETAKAIVRVLVVNEEIRGPHSLESLLLATATIIMMFAKGDPNDLAESYADELLDRVRTKAPGFPEIYKATGRLQ